MNIEQATKVVESITDAGPDIAEANAIELRALREFRKELEADHGKTGEVARKLAEGEKKAGTIMQLISSRIDAAKYAKDLADKSGNKMEEFRQSLLIQNWQEVRKAIKES